MVSPAATFKLAPVTLKLAGYSNAPDTRVKIDANVGIDGNAKLAAKGEVVPDTSAVAVHVDLNDFKLPSIQPYLGAYTQMTLSSGSLSAALDVRLAEQSAMTIAGSVDVAKLHTIDNALRQEFISWDRLKVSGIEYTSQPAEAAHRDHHGQLAVRAPDHCAGSVDQRQQDIERVGQRSGAHPDGEDRRQGSRREPVAASREHRRGARGQWRREFRRLLDPA